MKGDPKVTVILICLLNVYMEVARCFCCCYNRVEIEIWWFEKSTENYDEIIYFPVLFQGMDYLKETQPTKTNSSYLRERGIDAIFMSIIWVESEWVFNFRGILWPKEMSSLASSVPKMSLNLAWRPNLEISPTHRIEAAYGTIILLEIETTHSLSITEFLRLNI